ncbi:beta-lactamase-like protein [Geopyxis carbonaria]|nr:beta-lactamase-like protein [Geopyxis carbonaria]
MIVRPLLVGTAYLTKGLLFSDTPTANVSDPAGPTPVYLYHLYHAHTDTHLVWDLGIRSDLSSYGPAVTSTFPDMRPTVPHDAITGLRSHGVDPEDIEHVLLSHLHWDHTGDISAFPNAALHLGPGTKAALAPGWPKDPASEFDGRLLTHPRLQEVEFGSGPRIASWPANMVHDFFGDGSLYLVKAEGHMPGHMLALARIKGGWALLGGDSCHHETHLWEWDSKKGGKMSYNLHTDAAKARGNMARVVEFIRAREQKGEKVVRAFAHLTWLEDWKPL